MDYSEGEMSFRQTINANRRSDRGFTVEVDRENQKVLISFDYSFVDCIFREILKDRDNRIDYLATLNAKDFADVCSLRNTEIIQP